MRTPVAAVIIAAMEAELTAFTRHASRLGEVQRQASASWSTGELDGRPVVLARCGIGLVSAACAASLLLDRFDPDLVISVGSAGGMVGRVRVGEVAVSDELTYSTADAVGFGYAIGQVPGLPERFRSDRGALSRAAGEGVVAGLFASGDVFVAGDRLDAVRRHFPEVVAMDMESTSIAQVCAAFGVGFISVRGISDLCGPQAEIEHAERLDDVSDRSAEVVRRILASA